jgi:hypothetical protein
VPEQVQDAFDIEQDAVSVARLPAAFANLAAEPLACALSVDPVVQTQTIALNTTQALVGRRRLSASTPKAAMLLRLNPFTGVQSSLWEALPVTVIYTAGCGAHGDWRARIPCRPRRPYTG